MSYVSVQYLRSDPDIKSYVRLSSSMFRIQYKNGLSAVRLYKTDIITTDKNGCFMLDSGGWHTRMTSQYINEHIPRSSGIYIHSKDYDLVVRSETSGMVEFFDGICFNSNGIQICGIKEMSSEDADKLLDSLK